MTKSIKNPSNIGDLSIDEKFNLLFNEINTLQKKVDELTAINKSRKAVNKALREQQNDLLRSMYGKRNTKPTYVPENQLSFSLDEE